MPKPLSAIEEDFRTLGLIDELEDSPTLPDPNILITKVAEEVDHWGRVCTEVDLRIEGAHGELLEANLAKETAKKKVGELLKKWEMTIEEYRRLSGLVGPRSENGDRKGTFFGVEFEESEVFDLMDKMAKNVEPSTDPFSFPYTPPLRPLVPLKLPDDPADAIKRISSLRMDMKHGNTGLMSLADTAVSTGGGGRRRA